MSPIYLVILRKYYSCLALIAAQNGYFSVINGLIVLRSREGFAQGCHFAGRMRPRLFPLTALKPCMSPVCGSDSGTM